MHEGSGSCPATDATVGFSCEQNQQVSLAVHMQPSQLKARVKQMWIVWSISALIAFSFVLSFFEKPPGSTDGRSKGRS